MHFLGGDADLRPQTEFAAVGEAGGGVDVHRRGVHGIQKALGLEVIGGDNGLGVAGAVAVDELHSLFQTAHGLDCQNIVVILGVPVGLRCRNRARSQKGQRFGVTPQLHGFG